MNKLYNVQLLLTFPDGNELEVNKDYSAIDVETAIDLAMDEVETTIQKALIELDSNSDIAIDLLNVEEVVEPDLSTRGFDTELN